jgi:hypothetical protein
VPSGGGKLTLEVPDRHEGTSYAPDWLGLSDALDRFVTRGWGRSAAQRDLSSMIADSKIGVRVKISRSDYAFPGRVLTGGHVVKVPEHLKSDDLDWQQSSALTPWPTKADRDGRKPWSLNWVARYIEYVEVRRHDVEREMAVLMGTSRPVDSNSPTGRQVSMLRPPSAARPPRPLNAPRGRPPH